MKTEKYAIVWKDHGSVRVLKDGNGVCEESMASATLYDTEKEAIETLKRNCFDWCDVVKVAIENGKVTDWFYVIKKNPIYTAHDSREGCNCYKVDLPYNIFHKETIVLCPVKEGRAFAAKLALDILVEHVQLALKEDII